MSGKPKFDKLRLEKTSSKQKTQISRFFSEGSNSGGNPGKINSASIDLDKPPLKKFKESSSEPLLKDNNTDNLEGTTSSDTFQRPNCPASNHDNLVHSKNVSKLKSQTAHKNSVIKFFNQSGSDNDFDTPKRQVKKPSVIKNRKKTAIARPKKQIKIKSAFLKSEEVFSDVVAQHGIADNIDPDELQMALALSKSELDFSKCDAEISEEGSQPITAKNIREKLQAFGFKTTTNDRDYDISLFVPGKKKGKWANKFTALTLRDPKRQAQKLEEKVEQILCSKFNDQNTAGPKVEFLLVSKFLKHFESQSDLFKRLQSDEFACKTSFYVPDLFTPSTVKAGYLLKDFRRIPGRDLSPLKKQSSSSGADCQEILSNEEKLVLSCESGTNNTDENLDFAGNYEDLSKSSCTPDQTPCSEPTEAFDKNIKEKNNGENILQKSSADNVYSEIALNNLKTDKIVTVEISKIWNSPKAVLCSRESSPDLFAECELSVSEGILGTDNYENNENFNENTPKSMEIQHRDSNPHFDSDNYVISYEKYSSDEVKIANTKSSEECPKSPEECPVECATSFENNFLDDKSVVDLTADSDSSTQNVSKPEDFIEENVINDANEFCSQLLSQQSSSNDSCIILSDDEVNYSIIAANKKAANAVDLTFSSSSDNSDSENGSPETKRRIIINQHNFSFIKLIDDEDINIGSKSDDSLEFESPNKSQCINTSRASKCNSARRSLSFPHSSIGKDKLNSPENDFTDSRNINKYHSESIEKAILNFPEDICAGELGVMEFSKKSVENKFFEDLKGPETAQIQTPSYTVENCDKRQRSGLKDLSVTEEQILDASNISQVYRISCNSEQSSLLHLQSQPDVSSKNLNFLGEKSKNKRSQINKTLSDSFIRPGKVIKSPEFKRHFSHRKFIDFAEEDIDFSDIDEIDKLVYGSPVKKLLPKKPEGFEKLLNADLSFVQNNSPRKFVHDGKTYLVRTENISPKPDYEKMDSPTRLKELYKYGLKPLKKKQAIIILDYIYNQTHPYIVEDGDSSDEEDSIKIIEEPFLNTDGRTTQIPREVERKYNTFNLKDCFGNILLKHDELIPEIDKEEYIFQTNVRSKIPTVLVPLHIAWYNLIKSNNDLREAVLHYNAIDLHEIFLFFKKLGYRYDPKDMKKFFDRRCIIFRYDLNEGTTNRHVRKNKKTLSQKSIS